MAQDNKINNKEIEQFFNEISTAELTEDEIMKAFLDQFQERIENGDYAIEFTDEMKQELDAFVRKNDSKRRCEIAKELLEKKYNKEFEILRYRGDKFPDEYYAVDAYEKQHPSIVFEARINNDENELTDSYVMKLVCESIREKIIKNLNAYSGDMSVLVFSETLITSLSDCKTSYEDVYNILPKNKYSIHLYFNSDNEHKYITLQELCNMLIGFEHLSGSVNIFVVDQNKKMELLDYVKNRARLYSSYWDLAGKTHIGCIRFISGVFQIREEEFEQMMKNNCEKS